MKVPVSVIMPAFNAERYIAESIESILSQSFSPEEIIVVNDASTDGTVDVVRQYPQVKLVENTKNIGICATLNHGLEVASMPWIAFLDSDDLWAKRKLELQWQSILQKGEQAENYLFFTHVEQFISPDLTEAQKQEIRITQAVLPGYLKITLVASRESFNRVGVFNPEWKVGDFIDWYARAKELDIGVVMLPDVLARRRIHINNISRQSIDDRAQFAKILLASIKRRNYEATDPSKQT